MKRILLSFVLAAACFTLSAAPPSDFVIRMLNGVTLENATVDSMSGSRVIVTGRLPDGSITTKTVSFSDLTPESRDALMWQMRDRLMLDSKPGWFFSGPAVAGNDLPPVQSSGGGIPVPADFPIVLPGSPGRISLLSITELTNGTLGWAASWDDGFVAQPAAVRPHLRLRRDASAGGHLVRKRLSHRADHLVERELLSVFRHDA